MIQNFFLSLWTALAFLTRLVPGRECTEKELADSVPLYPLAGLILGLLLVLPFYLGLASGSSWVRAWLFLAASLWLTRGLHWDGLADLADAWGSGADGDRFWDIIKDSRMGAFGGMGLVMGLAGQLILLEATFARSAWGLLVWAPLLGRTMVLPLAAWVSPHPRSSLGRLMVPGASGKPAFFAFALAALAGILLAGPAAAFCGLGLATLAAFALGSIANRHGGLNGDFFGTLIIMGELAALLGGVLV